MAISVTSNPTWTIPHELIAVSRLWIRFLFQLLSRKLNWIWNNSIRMIFLVMTNIENRSKAQSKTEPPFPLKSKYYLKSKQIQFFLVCTSAKTGSKLHIGPQWLGLSSSSEPSLYINSIISHPELLNRNNIYH